MTVQTPPRVDGPLREVVLTDASRALRRRLGPTAWVVLEELLLDAADGESMVVETHVRRIAAGVGISKDSAARALLRLIELGVVTRRSGRDAATGCFGRSVYELRREAIVGVVAVTDHIDGDGPKRMRAQPRDRRRRSGSSDGQASLFDASAGCVE